MAESTIYASDKDCFMEVLVDRTTYPLLSPDQIWVAHMHPAANATRVCGSSGSVCNTMRIGQYKWLDDLYLWRHVHFFASDSLVGQVIDSAKLRFYPTAPSTPHIVEEGIHPKLVIVSGTDAPDGGCVAGTFFDLLDETVEHGSILLEDVVNNVDFDIPLNAVGLALIEAARDSGNPIKLGLRLSLDIDTHVTPYHDWAGGGDRVQIAGPPMGALAPRLIVTTTPIIEPIVTTDAASLVTTAGATLNGTLDDDGGEICACGFEYGIFPNFTHTTPTQYRTTGQTFSQALSGLLPNTTYQFRAKATNSAGTSYGATRTFTTVAIVLSTTTTDPATDVAAISADINGTLVNDGGEACDCGFDWGLTAAYGNTTPTTSHTTGQSFTRGISGLLPNTLYHFRAFATNDAGTSYGIDRTFTTLPSNPGITTPQVTTNPATRII